jgi:DNA-binding NtrC family response regulator
MNPVVLMVNTDKNEAESIGDMMRAAGYTPCIVDSIAGVETTLATNNSRAVLLDLDSVKVCNRDVRQLTSRFPRVCFLCTSRIPFHPELEDAIGFHFYACIQKPIDPDELLYWLKCIHHNMEDKA